LFFLDILGHNFSNLGQGWVTTALPSFTLTVSRDFVGLFRCASVLRVRAQTKSSLPRVALRNLCMAVLCTVCTVSIVASE